MWDTVFFGNTLRQYAVSGTILVSGFFLAWLASAMFKRAARRSNLVKRSGDWVGKIVFPLALLGVVFVGLNKLQMPGPYRAMLDGAASIILTFIIVRAAARYASRAVNRYFERNAEDTEVNRLKPLRNLLVVLIWLIGFIFLLDNLGFDINAVVAGIGVSGIAVAIAAQGILGDLFNYFVIIIDKPFEVGDFIVFDDKLGAVKKIGVKTTRIRVPGGEELVVANTSLATSRIHNYKRMDRRLVIHKFGVRYDTPVETLERLPSIVEDVLADIEGATFDRCHFSELGDSALMIETAFFVDSPDYRVFMDTKQAVNLGLVKSLASHGVEFAFPTRAVVIEGLDGLPSGGRGVGFSSAAG